MFSFDLKFPICDRSLDQNSTQMATLNFQEVKIKICLLIITERRLKRDSFSTSTLLKALKFLSRGSLAFLVSEDLFRAKRGAL